MGNKYDSLVEEINKQEEVKEEMVNLENDIQLLKQAMSDLHDNVQKVEKAAKDSMDTAVSAFCRAVTRAESTVLKVEMTDECQNAIKSAREELIKAEITLLASHRKQLIQEIHNQNEEMQSFIKSGKGVYLSSKVFWWGAGISYATSLYSFWSLLQLLRQWLNC